jgi:hypothetical protein
MMSQYSEAQIVEIEERLRQAMLHSDVAELDALIAPEIIFTTHLGQLYSKEEDLAAHRSGVFKFRELTPSEQRILIHNGFAVVSVKMRVLGSYEGSETDFSIRFTRVWSKSSTDSLQIIAGHTSVVAS